MSAERAYTNACTAAQQAGAHPGAAMVCQLATYRQACAFLLRPEPKVSAAEALLKGLAEAGMAVAMHTLALAPLLAASQEAGIEQRRVLEEELELAAAGTTVPVGAEKQRSALKSASVKVALQLQQVLSAPRRRTSPRIVEGAGIVALKLRKHQLDLLEKAAKAGLPYSQHILGLHLLHRQKRMRRGVDWLTRASDQGFLVATLALADYHYLEAEKVRPLCDEGSPPTPGSPAGATSTPAPGLDEEAVTAGATARAASADVAASAAAAAPAQASALSTDTPDMTPAKAKRRRALHLEKAASWYEVAALEGEPRAQLAYGLLLRHGLGCPRKTAASISWIRKSAKQGHAKAMYYLGCHLVQRQALKRRVSQRGLRYLRRAYLERDAAAALFLGRLYEKPPTGVSGDPLAAMAYYDMAVTLGSEAAANDLARLQAHVLPAVKPEETFAAYTRLAPQCSAALVNAAICYSGGYGTKANLGKALACARQSVERNFAPAENIYALLQLVAARADVGSEAGSEAGSRAASRADWQPPKELLQEVLPRFRRAAEAGDPDALYNLARCLLLLDGSEVEEAVAFLCEAAAYDHVGAQMDVGVCMQRGLVLKQDERSGTRYIRRARAQGVLGAATAAAPAAAGASPPLPKDLNILPWPPASVGLHHTALRQKVNPDFVSAAEVPAGLLSAPPGSGMKASADGKAGKQKMAGDALLKGLTPEAVRDKAKKGDMNALCRLGLWHLQGVNVECNVREAARCFEQAAEQGLAAAQSHIAECYLKGVGVDPDATKAVDWFEKAAAQDEPVALCNLAHLWQQGQLGSGESPAERAVRAARLYDRAAQLGMASAQCCLASCYFEGKGVPQSDGQAVYWWQKARQGDVAEAWFNLGVCYLQGRGLPEDVFRARQYFLESAVRGNVTGQCNMGVMYERGLGGANDLKQAYSWWRRAARKRNPAAYRSVGHYLLHGIGGIARCVRDAVEYLRHAAMMQDTPATLTLAQLYESGDGEVEVNLANAHMLYKSLADKGILRAQLALAGLLERTAVAGPQALSQLGSNDGMKEAEQWFRRAAESGAPEARYQLARFLCARHGRTDAKWTKEIFDLCTQAAQQGHAPAKMCLSLCFENGIGVAADEAAAKHWLREAKAAEAANSSHWPPGSLERLLLPSWRASRGDTSDKFIRLPSTKVPKTVVKRRTSAVDTSTHSAPAAKKKTLA